MQDKWKEEIEGHRDEFDVYDFDVDIGWEELSHRVVSQEDQSGWFRRFGWKVAAAASVVFAVFVAYQLGAYKATSEQEYALIEVQSYYESEIDAKLVKLGAFKDDPILMADLEALDLAINDLKADLGDQIDNEEVVNAMMENYRLKLHILERMLEQLGKRETGSDEKVIM